MMDGIEKILFTEEMICKRVHELGSILAKDYNGKSPVFIGILKGAVPFIADLIRTIPLPLKYDLMSISSYGESTKSSGIVKIQKDIDIDIVGQDTLIVEDIVDTGLTLQFLLDILQSRRPKSLKICSLLDKPARRKIIITPDYKGFEIPDLFVVGYGLDYAEKYRNLPYIGVLNEEYIK
jgi:hypoxanthine phosphoribosyltransferase